MALGPAKPIRRSNLGYNLPVLIDTHCHLYFDKFDADRGEMIARMAESGVPGAVVIGIDDDTNGQCRELARRYRCLRYAVGLHPTSEFPQRAGRGGWDAEDYLGKWWDADPRPVAVGECGIDLHWDTNPLTAQQPVFKSQLEFARDREVPVIVHTRDADLETLEVLESVPGTTGVLHCFNGSEELLRFALNNDGWYVSFAGNLTYPKAVELKAVAPRVPLGKLLVETDAPFLAPQARRGKRNEPGFVRFTAAYLAELLEISIETLSQATTANAEKLFGTSWQPDA